MAVPRRPGRPGRPGRPTQGLPIVRKNTVRLPGDIAHRIRLDTPGCTARRSARGRWPPSPGRRSTSSIDDGEFVGRGLYDADSAIALRVFVRNPTSRSTRRLIARAGARGARAARSCSISTGCSATASSTPSPTACPASSSSATASTWWPSCSPPRSPACATTVRRARRPSSRRRRSTSSAVSSSLAGEAPRQAAAELVRGNAAPVELEVKEDDLTFVVDVTAPLSTGLFADLREGRRAVRHWAAGRRVLNLFSYTGAISVYAHAGGATEVCAVDVAAKAHARARRNFAASGFDPRSPSTSSATRSRCWRGSSSATAVRSGRARFRRRSRARPRAAASRGARSATTPS